MSREIALSAFNSCVNNFMLLKGKKRKSKKKNGTGREFYFLVELVLL